MTFQDVANVTVTPELMNVTVRNFLDVIHATFDQPIIEKVRTLECNPDLDQVEAAQLSIWWAKKELNPEETLTKYIGTNDRTKINVTALKVLWQSPYNMASNIHTRSRTMPKEFRNSFEIQRKIPIWKNISRKRKRKKLESIPKKMKQQRMHLGHRIISNKSLEEQ